MNAELKRLEKTLSEDKEHKYYVYMLTLPDGSPIYIGKGQGVRMFAHEWAAMRQQDNMDEMTVANRNEVVLDKEIADKLTAIRQTLKAGESITKVIVKWGLTEDEAFMCESALINLYKYLLETNQLKGGAEELKNKANGHASKVEGEITEARTIANFIENIAMPQLCFKEYAHNVGLDKYGKTIVFLKISGSLAQYNPKKDGISYDDFVYDCVRACWAINEHRYNRYRDCGKESFCGLPEYVIAIDQHVVVGCYKVKKWIRLSEGVSDFPKYPIEARENDRARFKDVANNKKFVKRLYFVKYDDTEIDNDEFFEKLRECFKPKVKVLLTDEELRDPTELRYWPFANK